MTASPGDASSAHLYLFSNASSSQPTRCFSLLRPLPEDCGSPEDSAAGEGQRPGEVKGERLNPYQCPDRDRCEGEEYIKNL